MWKFTSDRLFSPLGESWSAVSGSRGKMKLPSGNYKIGDTFLVTPASYQKGAYKDSSGFAWFCRIEPQFPTERTVLGIHPDGNLPGTLGCIGIKTNMTEALYYKLRNSYGQQLQVI